MKCEIPSLVSTLKVLSRATRRCPLPVLSAVHLQVAGDRVSLTCTNLDLAARRTFSICPDLARDGQAVVNLRSLQDAVKSLGKVPAVSITRGLQDGYLYVTAGPVSIPLPTLSPDEFPLVQLFSDLPPASQGFYSPLGFHAAWAFARPAVATGEEPRAILQGMQVSPEGLVATDGRHLHAAPLSWHGVAPAPLVVPPDLGDAYAAASKEEPLLCVHEGRVYLSEPGVFLQRTGWEFGALLMEGKFPTYRNLIPASFSQAHAVPAAGMAQVAKALLPFAQERVFPKLGILEAGGITARPPEAPPVTLPMPMTLPPGYSIAFNLALLRDAFAAFREESVTVSLNTPMDAAMVSGATGTVLIMPVRVRDTEEVAA